MTIKGFPPRLLRACAWVRAVGNSRNSSRTLRLWLAVDQEAFFGSCLGRETADRGAVDGGDGGVHRAGIRGCRRVVSPVEQRHQRVEREHLVGLPINVVADRLMLGGELGGGAQRLERPGGRAGRAAGDGERAEVVGVIGGAVLQPHLARGVEQHVEDRTLGRREQYLAGERPGRQRERRPVAPEDGKRNLRSGAT
jgi:hypothetical protein